MSILHLKINLFFFFFFFFFLFFQNPAHREGMAGGIKIDNVELKFLSQKYNLLPFDLYTFHS